MKAAANLTLLYGHLPLEARFAAAKGDGFSAVEILFPYDQPAGWYAAQLRDHGLRLVLVNTPIDAQHARSGRAAVPGQEDAFRADFARAAQVCQATGCGAVHVMAGCLPAEQEGAGRATLVSNLEWAATHFPGLVLQLEALNHFDVPGYFYSRPSAVLSILDEAGLPCAGMQFDFYHVLRQGLALEAELEACLPWIRHVQVAGSPERHEPDLARDAGYQAGFERLHAANYQEFVGFEYRPAADVTSGLRWAAPLSPYFSHLPTASFR